MRCLPSEGYNRIKKLRYPDLHHYGPFLPGFPSGFNGPDMLTVAGAVLDFHQFP